MAPKDRNPNGPAVEKRSKISKTQQQTLLIALITAVVVGICGVLAVFFGKYIAFNKKVIGIITNINFISNLLRFSVPF